MENKDIEFMTISTNGQNEKGKFKMLVQAYNGKELLDDQKSQLLDGENNQIGVGIMEINADEIDAKDPQNIPLIRKLEAKGRVRLTESARRRNSERQQGNSNISPRRPAGRSNIRDKAE